MAAGAAFVALSLDESASAEDAVSILRTGKQLPAREAASVVAMPYSRMWCAEEVFLYISERGISN